MLWNVFVKPEFDWDFDGFKPAVAFDNRLYRGAGRDTLVHSRYLKADPRHEQSLIWWRGRDVFKGKIDCPEPDVLFDRKHEELCWVADYDPAYNDTFGIDVIAPIVGSLIFCWLERYGLIEGLNEDLLFDDPAKTKPFIEAYLKEAALDRIEPPNSDDDVTLASIGLLNDLP